MREFSRRIAACSAALAFVAVALVAGPAQAAVVASLSPDGALTVEGDSSANSFGLACPGGIIAIDFVPLSGSPLCSAATSVHIDLGAGADQLNLGFISSTDFPAATTFSVDLGADSDSVIAPERKASITGGGGSYDRYVLNLFSEGTTIVGVGKVRAPGSVHSLSGVESVSVTLTGGTNTLDARTSTFGHLDVTGGSGNDTIMGSPASDNLFGAGGADTLQGRGGDDRLGGGPGDDSLNGGPGVDSVDDGGTTANVVLTDSAMTGAGSDTLASFEEARIVQSGSTGRVMNFSGFSGSVDWRGGSGADIVTAPQGGSTLDVSLGGADTLIGGLGTDTVRLSGDVGYYVTLTDTSLSSDVGVLTLSGMDAAALVGDLDAQLFDAYGFSGATTMRGFGGADTMLGGSGPDMFQLKAGVVASGDGGTDTIEMKTSEGDSLVISVGGTTGPFVSTFAETEVASVGMQGGSLDSTAFPGRLVVFDEETSQSHVDIARTGVGNDRISLGLGADELRGGGGADRLFGGPGSDLLVGGPGVDLCKGGPGKDVLVGCEKGKS